MKKLSLLCAVVVLSAASVGAFEVPSVPKISNPIKPVSCMTASASFNKAEAKQQVKGIEDSVDAINVALNESVDTLASVLANKKDLIALKAKRDELLKTAKLKERDAIIKDYEQGVDATLKASLQNAEINAQVKGLSVQQKELVGKCIGNLLVVAMNYTDIGLQAATVAQSIQSNPTAVIAMAPELKTLGKLATTLPGQAKSLGGLSSNLLSIAKAGGITVAKPTKGSKVQKIDISE